MNRFIRLLPRFVRLQIFGLIETEVESVDCEDIAKVKEIILARLAALMQL